MYVVKKSEIRLRGQFGLLNNQKSNVSLSRLHDFAETMEQAAWRKATIQIGH